ncbi:microfibril-associated protein [Entamoeba histolytica HM-3:IMSS]|uniref:Microfibril-associated protein, putative n=2 Tax=Entamoeba histolytica TaxID=5759 RepID=M2QC23_ENTHI|nr:microfibril-associated protein, putative [Entamoeba histolytica KU27]EMS13625.1 microfibril-associated protein [Entamoeba histolytica HM-3:IMSS]
MKKGLVITHRIEKIKNEDEDDIFHIQEEYTEEESNEEEENEEPIFVPMRKEIIKKEQIEEKEIKENVFPPYKQQTQDINTNEINKKLIQMTIQKELEQKENEESTEEFSSGDEYGGKDEFEAWQQRELERLKKEYIEQLNYQHDLEKLKEICSTESQNHEEEKKKERKKWKFMQKYYHIGSFFRDGGKWDVSKGNWDFDAATGDDWMDKSLLPKILQTKDWGKKGRSKHTNLKEEDTTYRNYD